ncbi:MAG TPA: ABC transporter substrate-binding protein [Dehalococcoidia bacterium]|nr:ABC transporter substrate-binding protein [Dehalococcoidia bacterium]
MVRERGYWQRVSRRRISRRAAFRATAATGAGLSAMALVGCGDDDDDDAEEQGPATGEARDEGEPVPGGTSRAGQTMAFNDVLDPHTSLALGAVMWSYIGNTALRLNREATQLEPELVASWEIPGDGTEIILTAQQGVQWHDKPPVSGRAFDAEDVAFNLMRIAGLLNPDEAARFQRRTDLIGMNRAEAVDAQTTRVVMDRPASTFLNGLTDFRNSFIPRDFLEKGGKLEDTPSLIGSGAFVLDTWQDGQRAVLAKNPNYFKAGMPYLDAVEWTWIPDRLSLLTAFSNGDVDFFVSPTKVERETASRTANDMQEENWVYSNWNHLRFNTAREPFGDPRVRRALFLALDYKAMADAYYGDGYWDFTGPGSAAFPEGIPSDEISQLPGWRSDGKDEDIATAKQLMEDAGFPEGNISFKILVGGPTQDSVFYDYSIRAIDQWKQVWPAMDAQVDLPPDFATFGLRQVRRDFDVIAYVIYPQPDILLDLISQYSETGSRNYGSFVDPRVDQLLTTAFSQLDFEERSATLREVQDYLINEQMATITVNQPRLVTLFTSRVRGMTEFGGQADGGLFDVLRHTEHMWLAD